MKSLKAQGFTLIELMIVVAIVGILAVIAYPSYQAQANKSRRADGIAKILEVAQKQERWFSQNQSYASALITLGYPATLDSDEGYYRITLADATACTTGAFVGCFTVTATNQGAQNSDTRCETLSVNDRGQRTATDSASPANDTTADCY